MILFKVSVSVFERTLNIRYRMELDFIESPITSSSVNLIPLAVTAR